MKLSRSYCSRLLPVAVALVLSLIAGAKPALTVAVFDFESPETRLKDTGAQLALLLNAELSQSDGIWLVERQQLATAVGEQELGASGMVDPASAARIGHLTGAKVLVLGRVFALGRDTMITAKIIGSETGRVFGQTLKLEPDAKLDFAASSFAKKIATVINENAGVLVAAVDDPKQRVDALRAKLGDRKLPALCIAIPEQHLTQRVVDPAAQTEITRLLGQLGATVLSAESQEEPAVLIRGKAFSEAGLWRGNLVSCRARVEIEVVDTASGKILLADRQVDVGVDITESIAAKMALQNAGAALTERILAAILAGH